MQGIQQIFSASTRYRACEMYLQEKEEKEIKKKREEEEEEEETIPSFKELQTFLRRRHVTITGMQFICCLHVLRVRGGRSLKEEHGATRKKENGCWAGKNYC